MRDGKQGAILHPCDAEFVSAFFRKDSTQNKVTVRVDLIAMKFEDGKPTAWSSIVTESHELDKDAWEELYDEGDIVESVLSRVAGNVSVQGALGLISGALEEFLSSAQMSDMLFPPDSAFPPDFDPRLN